MRGRRWEGIGTVNPVGAMAYRKSSQPPWQTPTSPTTISFSSPLPPVKRVAGGVGWVLHGLCFEFVDGTRKGMFLTNKTQESIDLSDDVALNARNAKWEDIYKHEYIIGITGFSSCFGFLAYEVILHTSEDREIIFRGQRPCYCGKEFTFSAYRGEHIIDATFKGGTCTGIVRAILPVLSVQEDNRLEEKGSNGTGSRSYKRKSCSKQPAATRMHINYVNDECVAEVVVASDKDAERGTEALTSASVVGDVPAFSPEAHGRPLDWNSTQEILVWGKKTVANFRPVLSACADVGQVMEFFRKRLMADGCSASSRLGPPEQQKDGWWRLAWLHFDGATRFKFGAADWQRAWHGCKFEALYSIIFDGRLCESRGEMHGGRILADAPGVYVHKDATSHKAQNYIRFVPLCKNSGVFWAAMWEVCVDRKDHVKVSRKTDQWVQPARAVHLVALWLCGRTTAEMRKGDQVSLAWRPKLEANPRDRWHCEVEL